MNVNTITAPLANSKEDVSRTLRRLVDEADRALKSAARTGDEKFDAARDQFVDQVRQIRSQLDEVEDTAAYRARRAARAADRSLHEHPYSAIGIAAAAGLLIGFLAARR